MPAEETSSLFLSRWLQFAALMRLFSVVLGYFSPSTIHKNVYERVSAETANPLQARTFATWTITSCILCLICAHDPSQPGIYYATMASFLIAFVHFFLEYTVYRTTARGALAPLVISSVSFLWMFVGRSYYLAHARAH